MKKYLCILVLLFFTGIAAFAQNAIINSSRSNIKRPSAAYSTTEGLVLTFKNSLMDTADKAALATGFFVTVADITLTNAECKALKVASGFKIKKGRWPITKIKGIDTCKPGFAIKEQGTK